MLIGKQGRYEKPKYPCRVPGCEKLSFQEEDGACKDHMFKMIDWLRNRVMLLAEADRQAALALDPLAQDTGKVGEVGVGQAQTSA